MTYIMAGNLTTAVMKHYNDIVSLLVSFVMSEILMDH